MVAENQLSEFCTAGYVRLAGAVPADVVASMRAATWEALGAKGVVEDDRSTWKVKPGQAWIAAKPRGHGVASVGPEDSSPVREALEVVLGRARTATRNWGKALGTFPVDAAAWSVPGSVWHFDHPYSSPGVITGVNLFLLIDDVAPQGGGTAVVRNSPQLLDRMLEDGACFSKLSAQNKNFLAATPWSSGLKTPAKGCSAERTARYLADTVVEGIPVRIEELCGSAGDVFVCHPALLHAPSMNVTDRPRLMRVQRVYATP